MRKDFIRPDTGYEGHHKATRKVVENINVPEEQVISSYMIYKSSVYVG